MTFGLHREQWSELPPLTIHPCRNPLLPPGIYTNGIPSYISTLLLPHPSGRRTCACMWRTGRANHAHHLQTSCPTNRDLSLLASRDGSNVALHTFLPDEGAREHLYARFPIWPLSFSPPCEIKNTHVETNRRPVGTPSPLSFSSSLDLYRVSRKFDSRVNNTCPFLLPIVPITLAA